MMNSGKAQVLITNMSHVLWQARGDLAAQLPLMP
jgi:hypothetical protein